jgi:hypothetical protein
MKTHVSVAASTTVRMSTATPAPAASGSFLRPQREGSATGYASGRARRVPGRAAPMRTERRYPSPSRACRFQGPVAPYALCDAARSDRSLAHMNAREGQWQSRFNRKPYKPGVRMAARLWVLCGCVAFALDGGSYCFCGAGCATYEYCGGCNGCARVCPQDKYSSASAEGSPLPNNTRCTSCPPGYSTSTPGATACEATDPTPRPTQFPTPPPTPCPTVSLATCCDDASGGGGGAFPVPFVLVLRGVPRVNGVPRILVLRSPFLHQSARRDLTCLPRAHARTSHTGLPDMDWAAECPSAPHAGPDRRPLGPPW